MDHKFLKSGDRVKIVRKVAHQDGWKNNWTSDMTAKIGLVQTIHSINDTGVTFNEIPYRWPTDALEKMLPEEILTKTAYVIGNKTFDNFEDALSQRKFNLMYNLLSENEVKFTINQIEFLMKNLQTIANIYNATE